MKKILTLQLVEKYPKLFIDYGKSPRESCMAFGCDCGDGWYNLIDDLCASLSIYEGVSLAQVKEKFGGLRVYLNILQDYDEETSDRIYNLTDEAETKSYKICELCGQPGILYRNGWHRTHCSACEDKYQKRSYE